MGKWEGGKTQCSAMSIRNYISFISTLNSEEARRSKVAAGRGNFLGSALPLNQTVGLTGGLL